MALSQLIANHDTCQCVPMGYIEFVVFLSTYVSTIHLLSEFYNNGSVNSLA